MNQRSPRNEPEVMRANAHHYVADCNRICRKPYGNKIFQALELAEGAYKAHRLPYEGQVHLALRRRWQCQGMRKSAG
jgi:hypothetical protein